jgi:uncharacterized protein YndB with AHSA1/START domain
MNDRREIRLEVEVPGTPEQVWDAIATGPGITSWFVPAEIDGERLSLEFGPGAVVEHRITASERPHRFVYEGESKGDVSAMEWLVEARSGGSCVVRFVQTGFEPGSSWEDDYDGLSSGWPLFLFNLRLYLTHFPGLPSASALANAVHPEPREPAWEEFAAALGLADAAEGDRVSTAGPVVAGEVVRRQGTMITLLLDQPTQGYALFASEGSGEQAYLSAWLYLFGDGAPEAAAEAQAAWAEWIQGFRLPGDVTLRRS